MSTIQISHFNSFLNFTLPHHPHQILSTISNLVNSSYSEFLLPSRISSSSRSLWDAMRSLVRTPGGAPGTRTFSRDLAGGKPALRERSHDLLIQLFPRSLFANLHSRVLQLTTKTQFLSTTACQASRNKRTHYFSFSIRQLSLLNTTNS